MFRTIRSSTLALALAGVLVLIVLAAVPAVADPGHLDTTFGDGASGTKTVDFPGTFAGANDLAIQPNGKIVLAGSSFDNGLFVALARLKPNGQLDSTFGAAGGIVVGQVAGSAAAVAIQPDGKIVVTGFASSSQGDGLIVARFTRRGALDTTFSRDGKLFLHFGFGDVHAQDVAIQGDGKIVVVGTADETEAPGGEMAVFRFHPDGRLDRSFNLDGTKIIPFAARPGVGNAVAIQQDGKIVVAGGADPEVDNEVFALARLKPTGSLDRTFSGDGRVVVDFTGETDRAFAAALQQDGKIVVAGGATIEASTGKFAVARLTSSGDLDTTFDGDGKTTSDLLTGRDEARGIAIQGNGRIVVAGTTFVSPTEEAFVATRYTKAGAIDGSFGDSGVADVGGPGEHRAGNIALQPDGKVVLAGELEQSDREFFALRWLTA